MIILLLGIISVYTLKTMDEINQIFYFDDELTQKHSNLNLIKEKYQKQLNIFESIKSNKNFDQLGSFWIYNTEIKNEFNDFNNFPLDNSQISPVAEKNYFDLREKAFSYYELHLLYENSAAKAIGNFYNNENELFDEFQHVEKLHIDLLEKIDEIERSLILIPSELDHSRNTLITNFEIFQWGMLSLIGLVTTLLVFLLNRTNLNLRTEIQNKTQNLKELNDRLTSMDKKRSEFISIASHELKGPIQPIFGFVELAKSGIISNEEALDGISNVSHNLENIANNVLDLTKIENNELELHFEKCSVHDIVTNIVESEKFNPHLKVPITTNFTTDVIMNLDITRIKQVLRNILDNCIKFTESGEISISSTLLKNKKELLLSITDSGPEIPSNVLPKIFEKFVTHKGNNVSGFGLGLYISKKIIDAHNGNITADNKNGHPVFNITLPILKLDRSTESNLIIKKI